MGQGSPPGRCRGRQRNGERIAAQDHEGNKPPDCALAVRIDPEELGDIPDGCSLSLDLPALGGHTGAFRLEGCQSTGLPVSLIHERAAGLPLPVHGGQSGIGAAALGGFLDRRVDLVEASVEIGDLVGLDVDLRVDVRISLLEAGSSCPTFPDMGGDQLREHSGRV